MSANNNFTIIGYVAETYTRGEGAMMNYFIKLETEFKVKDGTMPKTIDVQVARNARVDVNSIVNKDIVATGYISPWRSKAGFDNFSLVATDIVVLSSHGKTSEPVHYEPKPAAPAPSYQSPYPQQYTPNPAPSYIPNDDLPF